MHPSPSQENRNSGEYSPSFFRAHSRAWSLREICCDIAKELIALRKNLDSSKKELNGPIYSRLEHLGGNLIGLGITEKMHCPPSSFNSKDPLCVAEWVAGQLLETTGDTFSSMSVLQAQIGEWADELNHVSLGRCQATGYGFLSSAPEGIDLSSIDLNTAIHMSIKFLSLSERELAA